MTNISEFDQKSGIFAERILFNNRAAIIALCLIATILFAYQATKLHLAASFEKMIPTGHPFIINYMANKSSLVGMENVIRIAIENPSGTIFDRDYLETLRQINDEIFLIPGVDKPFMKSLWTPATRWAAVTEDGFDGGPVMPDTYDGSPRALEEVRINVERSGEIGQLVAANMRSSIMLVPLLEINFQTGRRLDYQEFSDRLETIRLKYQSHGVAIYITGFAKIVGDLIGGLKQVLVFFGLAILICASVLLWYTRCIRSTLLVVTCSLVAVIWQLGLLPTLGYELDPYSILVPFLVFAIGMSHGAQKMNGISQDIGRGTHRLVAARYTFRRLFVAGMTALLADAVGFAVLMVIDIRVIQELAIAASIGVLVLIFTNLVLLPILLSYTGVSATAAQRSVKHEMPDSQASCHKRHAFWTFLDHFTQRRAAALTVGGSVLIGILGFGASLNLKIGDLDPGAPELRSDSRYNHDNAFMTENYAASSDIYVVMVRTPQYQCGQFDTLVKVDALETELQQLTGVESTNSLAALAKRMAVGFNEGSVKWYEIPRSQDMLNAIVTRVPRDLINQNCDLLSVYAYLKDHKADTLDSVVRTVEAFATRTNTSNVSFIQAAGNSGIDAATNIVVKKANSQMMALVYLAVIILAFITFRSWRAVICAVLPLMLTSALCEALMVALGIGVKVATLPVIALGVGIGVDYALYILSVTLAHLRQGKSLSESYYRSLLFTGKVVILTGITLGIAVSTWAFSPIKFQADMGILLAFMFVWNMAGALILMPSLAYFLLSPKSK
ncbi:MMPL family transporter [Magnetospirillum sp. 15-1]|uniref:efflux RND transporter permease subunit n=1 Tax=Magnetospirillum sp. 15-1 TaxID=1979370 RepID=UPI0032221E1C